MNRSNKQISIDIKNGTLADTSNSTKLKELFNKRELYNNVFNNFNSNNIETIDIWNNKSLYGKINNEQQPIVPNYSKLKTISNNLNDTVFCIAPAADAFSDLIKSITYDFNLKKIKKSSYYPLIPRRSTTNCIIDLNNELNQFFSYYSTQYLNLLNKKQKVLNFNDYMNSSIDLLNLTNIVLTLSNYSIKQSPLSTGLVVDVAEDNASEDRQKQIKFLEDENFSYILNKAEQFGFLIDKNIPWRFVFNIKSPNAERYLSKYNVATLNEFFDAFYFKTITLELDLIKQIYVNSYNEFVRLNPYTVDECNNIKNYRYDIQLSDVNDDFKWLKFHYFLKLKEINKVKNKNQYEQLIYDFITLYNLDKNNLIEYIEKTTKVVYGGGANPDWLSTDLTTRNLDYKINFKF